ncbi:putative membrane protein (TIGR02226 family) [Arcticibacter pallidicorallinus]|uniref:Putative membrane protein (TIGR02226 family) n=1 Tax=Arcticibacter pallidicorallinus TaxID=1259464 RepID=A0A2T0U5I3_9SPHI|nr:BatA domain-containing protein [Arcticibacter pallidicorallinus]PRY53185.1 putative membrane protein (TIGR02226 family) [Arcticibacter pallidicorallinus]
MRFLFPEFLFALGLIAVPVIVHLFNFRRFKRVYFSNVSLLKKVELETTGSRQVKRYALLLCRSLAVAFLVLAFARPYVADHEGAAGADAKYVSVYIDNSYSMEAVSREGSLLEEAKKKAKDIAAVYGANTKIQLVTNDFEGLHQRLMTKEEFQEAVDTIRISARSRSVREVLDRQNMLFSGKPVNSKVAYFLSDFQRNLWDGQQVGTDSLSRYSLVKLKAEGLTNISIDSLWFVSPLHKPGGPEQLVVRLRNNSDNKAEQVTVKLQVGGHQKALSSVDIEGRQDALDTLAFNSPASGWQEASVAIVDNPFTFDDRYFFTYPVRESLPILILDNKEPNVYVDAVYRSEAFFKAEHTDVGHVNYSWLDAYPMVVLPGSASISEGLIQRLTEYVRKGGTLFLFPPSEGKLSELESLSLRLGIDKPLGRVEETVKTDYMDRSHSIFRDVFQAIPRNMDLPEAKSYVRYSDMIRSSRRTLLKFENKHLLLAQYAVGAGQVFLSAVAADEESSNLVRHSLFVPIMYQSAFSSLRDQPLYYTLGKDELINLKSSDSGSREGLRLRDGDSEIIPDIRQTESGVRMFISDQVIQPGIYDLTRGDRLISKVAFNINPSESDLSYLSDDMLEKVFPDAASKLYDTADNMLASEIKAENYGVQLWKLCLILSLICLAAEILLLRYYGQKT